MKDKDKAKRNQDDAQVEGDEGREPGVEEAGQDELETVELRFDQIREDMDKARQEAADYLDSLQRLKAEFDNFRKRMLREQSDFLELAAQGVIASLLPVVDSFERALAHEMHDDHIDEFKNGLQVVYSQLVDVLAKEGLTPLEPVGEAFDPTQHEAMMQVASDDHPEGTVVAVLEKGYALKDRVIRPAKVSVAG